MFDRSRFELSPGIVHVWDGIGPIDQMRYSDFFAILDDSEHQRALKFRSEQHRIRFVTSRGWLRLLLAAYTGLYPGEINLASGDYGKPRLRDNPLNTGLVFNVSHSEERMVFAFALDCLLGVDIERIRNMPRLEAIVDRICSVEEKTIWASIPPARQLEAFFAIWVRKEAIIKAHGQGFSLGMRDCVLSNDLRNPIRLPESCGNVKDWTLIELGYAENYRVAVAVNRPFSSVVRRVLPEQQLLTLYSYRRLG